MNWRSPWHSRGRGRIALAALLALVVAAGAAVALSGGSDNGAGDSGPPEPGAFYAAPDPLPAGRPGSVLRFDEVAQPPPGTLAYRLLYLSRGYAGRPVALSALLIVPAGAAPSSGRNVVAATHGTVGIAPRCAPSNDPDSWQAIPGLAQFVRDGDAVVVPDGEGLGTRGPPHPYLVGDAEARATLDAVRAVAMFAPAGASRRFVVWGPSQGGHAALFAGQLAARYAPELELAGVAAAAPMTDLPRILALSRDEPAGRIMAAYVLSAWSQVYPRLRLGDVVSETGSREVERAADRCIALDSGPVAGAPEELGYVEKEPFGAAPLPALLARNTPSGAGIAAPVLITQGTRDRLVRPPLTRRFVRRLCSRGVRVRYRAYRRVAHRDIGRKSAADVASWIAERFAGAPVRTSCR